MIQKYRLTKLAACEDPLVDSAADIEEYRKNFDYSPPVDYYVEGVIYDVGPKVGQPFVIIRDNRNGIKCDGIMRTSHIVEISQHEDGVSQILETQNSIYFLKPL
jgi:hypothetical protein